MHASASPFEAYAERLNWLAADAATDSFGVAALAAGVPADTLAQWTKDPQVRIYPHLHLPCVVSCRVVCLVLKWL